MLQARLSHDLRSAFPDLGGFSPRNLRYMRSFAAAWSAEQILQAPLANLPWYHHLALLTKVKTPELRLDYAEAALALGWSRNALELHIDAQRIERSGKAVTNFDLTMPQPESALARETLKDPYRLDFLGLGDQAREREVEASLIAHTPGEARSRRPNYWASVVPNQKRRGRRICAPRQHQATRCRRLRVGAGVAP